MENNVRTRLGRLAVFLLSVVMLSIFLGVILGHLPISPPMRKTVAVVSTLAIVAIGYAISYRPGWLYRSLVDSVQEEPHGDH